tara:strand:+ start:42 stop:236 length:195 start_codon:yes stop_codon:yes gene_type:complete
MHKDLIKLIKSLDEPTNLVSEDKSQGITLAQYLNDCRSFVENSTMTRNIREQKIDISEEGHLGI